MGKAVVKRLTRRAISAWRAACRRFGLHLGQKNEYVIGGIKISLPREHLLPEYQRDHPLYDRFLPHMARFLRTDGVVVDVGANVGDTVAAMVSANPGARYICVEPDPMFFSHLEANIAQIEGQRAGAHIEPVCALIGCAITAADLTGGGGSRHACPGETAAIPTVTLDRLLADRDIRDHVRMIKSDVDGFDYDVLDSAAETIRQHAPLLYFECQCDSTSQRSGFAATLSRLEGLGYCDWSVFDNFGALLLRTGDLATVSQLIDYAWQQRSAALAKPTIYYVDVLAAQKADIEWVSEVLASYPGATRAAT